MKIKDLFLKPVERPIEGVIKADDNRNLLTELEEYVITRDVARGLGTLTERYLDDRTANGVWISGFFGSGKSHLLKMLSLVLDGHPLENGVRSADILLPKIEDEIVQASLRKAASIPSRSILFNIDQKFDGIGGDHSAPILEVFVKVMNEMQGYFGNQGYIAQFEYDLDKRNEFDAFRETYKRINRRPWEQDREAITTVRASAFGKAYAEHCGVPVEEAHAVIRRIREDYRVSIESFVHRVRDYIDAQPAGFRLNFFIDEVGQFIGQDSKRMLNLQTLAETLGTVCSGRAWVFVTSQADLEGVLGDFRNIQAQDISKIQGRFKTRITLASADVREVIQKRLLAKKEDEPEVLTTIWDREKDNLQTLFRFGDQSRSFHGWRGSDEFCGFYPFHPYQFELFQEAITQLSKHGAFTGKHQSVGERSMLAVFQEVAKSVRNEQVGRLATFDHMYDGIAASIRGDMQTSVKMAENQLGDGLQLRILKSLFLLKWVREFKATPRNIAILLIDRPDLDIRAHEQSVKEALAALESQSYLQGNGDAYEFLTDTEKDIEVEIKNTEVDELAVAKLLVDTLFSDVLRDPKIRYDANQQDYSYSRKLDDALMGREFDIALNIITTEHPNYGELSTLAAQNMGRSELLAVLPADTRLNDLARLYAKTEKYIRQNSGGNDASRAAILDQRGQQNSSRRSEMITLASDFLSRATLFLNGSRLETAGQGEPRGRFTRAFQELIAFAYPNLKMLKGAYDETALAKTLLDPDDLIEGTERPLTEAEGEILTYVRRNQDDGQRTSIDEIVRVFGRRPYGWYSMAVLTLVARLFRMGKVELRDPTLLDAQGALNKLRNSRQHGGVRVRLQELIPPGQVSALKNFHHDFFDTANDGTEARSVAQRTSDAFRTKARVLSTLIDQASRYAFLAPLRPVVTRLEQLGERDHTWLLKNVHEFSDELLEAKENFVGPVESFMHGPQRVAYDEAIAFLREQSANLADLSAAEVQPLSDLEASEHPYRGNVVPNAKAAVGRLRGLVADLLAAERERALAVVDEHESRLKADDDFTRLSETARSRVLGTSILARADFQAARFVSGVRDRLSRYTTSEYPAQLTLLAQLAAQEAASRKKNGGEETSHPPVPIHYTPAASLRPTCSFSYIASAEQLNQWLDALRALAQGELAKGNRISL
jgi:hypothetical protein